MEPFIPETLPVEVDYSKFTAEMGEANRALASYNALTEQSPSPEMLLAPFVRREAMLSSRIEGSQSTLNEVLRFDEGETPVAKGEQLDDLNEIRNYISALQIGEERLRNERFSLGLLRELHKELLGRETVRGGKKNPGNFRAEQNFIGRFGTTIEEATFIPPKPIAVQECMENWERFYLSNQPDAIVQAAILHAQFELIHPFEDGNGRIGRLIIPLFLYEKRLISRPCFYLSACLEKKRDSYMNGLKGLNKKPVKWDWWIWFFLTAVATQAKEDSERIKRIAALYEEMKKRFVDLTHSQFAVPVLDAVFERPVFRRSAIESKLSRLEKPPSGLTVNNILRKLVDHDVLQVCEEGRGRRATIYELSALMELLEDSD